MASSATPLPLEPLKRLLITRTEGNPFFLEESVRTLAETQVIVGPARGFPAREVRGDIQVPATVQAVLAARIDRLPPSAKNLLQSAAVIGKDVSFALLEAVAERPAPELQRELAQLQAADSVRGESVPGTRVQLQARVDPRGGLSEPPARASALSPRAALADARGAPGRPCVRTIEGLAHHAVRGKVWPRAATYLYRAGANAQAEARYAMAAAFYTASLDAREHLGPGADQPRSRRIPGAMVHAHSTGHVEGIRSERRGPDHATPGQIALAAAIPGTLESAIVRAREAVALADESDCGTQSYAHLIAAIACRDLGRIDEAVAEYQVGGRLFAAAGTSDR